MNKKNIRGYPVYYDNNAIKAIDHLAYVLSFDETDSLFRSARLSGKVEFEDRIGRNFTLINTSGRNFQVKKR
ncbi:hypothetical protein KKG58_04245 [Patescibacteria group bacterium]|nr:hypothetical protein [Patescibacteria group bacterium]